MIGQTCLLSAQDQVPAARPEYLLPLLVSRSGRAYLAEIYGKTTILYIEALTTRVVYKGLQKRHH